MHTLHIFLVLLQRKAVKYIPYSILYRVWYFWHTVNGRHISYREVNILSRVSKNKEMRIYFQMYGGYMGVARDLKNLGYNILLFLRKHSPIGCRGNKKQWQTRICDRLEWCVRTKTDRLANDNS